MQKEKAKSLVTYGMFVFTAVIYTCALLQASLFKYISVWELFSPDRFSTRGVNLIPFNTYGNKASFRQDIFLNLIMYPPFGFMLAMKRKPSKRSLWLLTVPFLCSVVMESLQYAFSLGAFDITDIIVNTFGGCLGFFLYMILAKLFKNYKSLNFVLTIIMFAVACFILFLMI